MWMISGDLGARQGVGATRELSQQKTYENCFPGSVIEKITIQNLGERHQVIIKAKDATVFQQIESATIEKGFQPQQDVFRTGNELHYSSTRKENLALFINTACHIEPHFNKIKSRIAANLSVNLSQEHILAEQELSSHSFLAMLDGILNQAANVHVESNMPFNVTPIVFLANFNLMRPAEAQFEAEILNAFREQYSPPIVLPSLGDNSEQLDKVGFNGDIPDAYQCSINFTIMSDPVFDPRSPNYKFEKTWIEQEVALRPRHPFTKASLTKEMLKSDNDLKIEIDAFVAEQVLATKPKPALKKQ